MLQSALEWSTSRLRDLLGLQSCCCAEESELETGAGDLFFLDELRQREQEDLHGAGRPDGVGEPVPLSRLAVVHRAPCWTLACDVHESGDASSWPCTRPRSTEEPSESMRESSEEMASREIVELRELMKNFVQDLVQGRSYLVVTLDGQTQPCRLTLTTNLLCFQLEAAGVIHDIPVRNIKRVCPGELFPRDAAPVALDDLCDTLVLRNNECVTFRLGSVKERDEFTRCVQVLLLTLDS